MISPDDVQTYVINLRRREDRRERIAAQLPTELKVEFTSDWTGPFDGGELTREALTGLGYDLFPWQLESDNPWWRRPLKRGEIGCALSHLACWQHALSSDAGLFLVLEDDVTLPADFLDRLLAGAAAILAREPLDLVYLDRRVMEPDRPAWPGFVRPGFSYCTWGYLLGRRAVAELAAAGLERGLIPVDEFLPAMYLDHPRQDVRSRFPRRIGALAFAPPLLEPNGAATFDSDTEDSSYADW